MYQNPDLHCHSHFSDGTLSPSALAQMAVEQGVDLWALTDHDSVDGLAEAQQAAQALGLAWVSGVEVSVQFLGETIHIVGLGIDTQHPGLLALLAANRHCRIPRAQAMAAQLEAVGIAGAYDGAMRYCQAPELLSRTHFGRFLVESGHCANVAEVFRHYLTEGKPGYMPPAWASLADGVTAIGAAGGLAVLAHPARYKLDALQMDALFDAFTQAGGRGLEVSTSAHHPHEISHYAQQAQQRGLLASCGSDFHSPEESRWRLGELPPMPAGLVPVWSALPISAD